MPAIEELGFSQFHRVEYKLDEQLPNTRQVFPDTGIEGEKIENLNVRKLRAGSLNIDEYIQSTGFISGSTGWQINGDGTAEFVGITLSGGTFKYGKTSFTDSTNAGYIFDTNGIYAGSASDTTYLKYNIGTGSFYLKIVEGLISGWTVSGTSITDTAGTVGLSSAVTGGNDIRIWAGHATPASAPFIVYEDGAVTATSLTLTGGVIKYGKTSFTDSTNAGYYISSAGVYFGAASDTTLLKYAIATGLIDLVGTISSRSTATIAAAINSSGNLVNDIINLRLDTSAKNILSDFAFGSTDYSGSLKCGTITWNTTTGAITGGSGGVFHKGGMVFANSGVATITLDATTGNATFAGTLSAPSGNIGGFTIGATTLAGGTTNIILDSSNKAISINDATFGNQGIQLQYNAGTPRAYVGNGVDQYFQFDGTNVEVNGTQLLFQSIYGDGSDGDVTISSNTNLTRDMYYNNLTISGSSIWLNPNGYRIFVKGTLTIDATCRIQRDGNAGTGGGNGENGHAGDAVGGTAGSAGAALADGSITGAVAGKAGQIGGAANYVTGIGGAGVAGTAGNGVVKSVGSAGAAGGNGGKGGGASGGVGGVGGAAGSQTGTVYNTIKNTYSAFFFSDTQSSTLTNFTNSSGSGSGGSGGAGGSQAGAYAGAGGGSGGSGSPGGVILIFVRNIVLNGDITAYGGNGGAGGNGGNATGTSNGAGGGGGGGGGAAGSGGTIVIVYNKKLGAGTIIAPAGTAGAKGNGGLLYGTGGQAVNGDDGVAGSAANSGNVILLQM